MDNVVVLVLFLNDLAKIKSQFVERAPSIHPWRPKGGQSGREKRRQKSSTTDERVAAIIPDPTDRPWVSEDALD